MYGFRLYSIPCYIYHFLHDAVFLVCGFFDFWMPVLCPFVNRLIAPVCCSPPCAVQKCYGYIVCLLLSTLCCTKMLWSLATLCPWQSDVGCALLVCGLHVHWIVSNTCSDLLTNICLWCHFPSFKNKTNHSPSHSCKWQWWIWFVKKKKKKPLCLTLMIGKMRKLERSMEFRTHGFNPSRWTSIGFDILVLLTELLQSL